MLVEAHYRHAPATAWSSTDKSGDVYVNDALLDEPYLTREILLAPPTSNIRTPCRRMRFFVLGDHRESSVDSRSSLVGCVEKEEIIGKDRIPGVAAQADRQRRLTSAVKCGEKFRMDRDIWSQAEQLNKTAPPEAHSGTEFCPCPSALSSFVTAYAHHPAGHHAWNSTPDTYCGIAEHVQHGNACYDTPGTPASQGGSKLRRAGQNSATASTSIHRHDSFCFDDSGELALCAARAGGAYAHGGML